MLILKSAGPTLSGTSVSGKVLRQGKSKKVSVVKFKRRQNYLRQGSHRQFFTEVEITAIGGSAKKAAPKKDAEEAAPKKVAKKKAATKKNGEKKRLQRKRPRKLRLRRRPRKRSPKKTQINETWILDPGDCIDR